MVKASHPTLCWQVLFLAGFQQGNCSRDRKGRFMHVVGNALRGVFVVAERKTCVCEASKHPQTAKNLIQ